MAGNVWVCSANTNVCLHEKQPLSQYRVSTHIHKNRPMALHLPRHRRQGVDSILTHVGLSPLCEWVFVTFVCGKWPFSLRLGEKELENDLVRKQFSLMYFPLKMCRRDQSFWHFLFLAASCLTPVSLNALLCANSRFSLSDCRSTSLFTLFLDGPGGRWCHYHFTTRPHQCLKKKKRYFRKTCLFINNTQYAVQTVSSNLFFTLK